MTKFLRQSSAAISWTQDGTCHAVRLKRTASDKCSVVVSWSGKADKEHTLAEILAEAAQHVGAKDADCLIAAPAISGWGTADIALPALPPDQISNALAFELRKHTPVPPEKLAWGYRTLEKARKGQRGKARLLFLKQELWRQWCATATPLAPLDAILPAPAALDPLAQNQTVIFPRHDGEPEAWTNSPDGRTFQSASLVDENDTPLPLQQLLQADYMNFGDIASLPCEQQYPFADAVIAAAYGLTGQTARDADTLIPLPDTLRAHRSIALVVSAVIFLAIAIASGVLYAVLLLQSNFAQQRDLQAEIARLDKLIAEQKAIVRPERLTKIKELEEEIKGDIPNYPPFALALKDITNIFDPEREHKPWISTRLQWSHDTSTIRFSIEEPLADSGDKPFIEDLNLLDELADSPYLIDVRGNSSSVNHNEKKTVRDFTLTLGWQSAEKRAAATERNQKRQSERAEARKRKLQEQQRLEQEEKQRQQQEAAAENEQEAAQSATEQHPAAPGQPPIPPLPQHLVNEQ